MARSSQGRLGVLYAVGLSLLSPGCIIPEAPDYGNPRQTPIFVVDSSIVPTPRNLLVIDRAAITTDQVFSMTVRSEDAGENIWAILFYDFKHQNGTVLNYSLYPAQTLDKPRTVSLSVGVSDPRLAAGCHTFTLMVVHEDGWDTHTSKLIGNPTDLASVTWFADIENSSNPAQSPPVSDCPNPSTETSTAK